MEPEGRKRYRRVEMDDRQAPPTGPRAAIRRGGVVVSRGGASDPELLMGGIPTTGADLNVSAGVVYSNLDSAFGDITRNGLPTRAAPSDDGTWCAVRDTKTGAILHP